MSNVLLFFIDVLASARAAAHNPLDGLEDAAPLAHFQNEKSEIRSTVCWSKLMRDLVSRDDRKAHQPDHDFDGHQCAATVGYHKQGFPIARCSM
jgi:hypothetical protein